MVFNILNAISQNSINQLFQSYKDTWYETDKAPSYTILELYNLWYDTGTFNDSIVICRAYYKYKHFTGFEGYWNAYFNYDTTTGLYIY